REDHHAGERERRGRQQHHDRDDPVADRAGPVTRTGRVLRDRHPATHAADLAGATGSTRRSAVPGAGRGSGSPSRGHSAIARSAWAVIVREGLTPRLAETAEPSTTCSPG